jgi:pyruvate/2-oxoglutarate dehydrogenase complex dihydrolipoamide dehydrogenase (E3) component
MNDSVRENLLANDVHDDALVANVHPVDWVNPQPAARYNLVVIGGGTAGLVTAIGAAGLGARVALVEKHLLGGDCLNYGCVPSKALLRAARARADVGGARELGVNVPPGTAVDFAAVMERVRRIRADISPHDSAVRLRGLGVDVFLGSARFSGDHVEVDGHRLRYKKAVIATGARAQAPAIPGLAEAGYLTNESVFSLTARPRRLAVIGAGPIGCELAQAFARLGSEVVLIQTAGQILNREDPDAARMIHAALVGDGVRIVTGASVAEVRGRADAARTLTVRHDGASEEVVADAILVGVGRAPNVEGLGLEAAGVAFDESGVTVDDRLRTTNRRIYAAGDVCSPYKFTHMADAMARIVIQNALFFGRAKMSTLTIPWCTYTDPEIAHVGLYEEEAQRRGIRVRTFVQELRDVDRAQLDGETEGVVKIHVREGSHRILGATIVARHAGEMISELTLAMVGGLGMKALARTIHPYPTQAEAIRKAADAWSRTRLTPTLKRLLARWLAFGR